MQANKKKKNKKKKAPCHIIRANTLILNFFK